MSAQRIITVIVSLFLCGQTLAQVQDIDKELSDLAERLAGPIKDHAKKKVAVIDFADLQGTSEGELGKYIAEQLTVNLVMGKRDFSVLDRANLRSILAEHKLTATGLIDPENAKKLGMFAGVDALILGTIIPKNQKIDLTAKIITTDTAEIIGAARAEFKSDETVQQLVSKPATEVKSGGGAAAAMEDKAKVIKSFGDLRVEVQSLKIVNGKQYLLTMTLANQSPKKTIWVAVSSDMGNNPKATVRDSDGFEFRSNGTAVSGVECTAYSNYGYEGAGFYQATEIKPGDSIPVTVKFWSFQKGASTGQCNLQIELLLSHDFSGTHGTGTAHNLVAKIEAE